MKRNGLSSKRGIVRTNKLPKEIQKSIVAHYQEFEEITKKLKAKVLISFDEISI